MTSLDFSQFRMNGFDWITEFEQKMGKDAFWKLLNDRYKWLASKTKGWKYNLAVSKALTNADDRNLFIKTVCLFISDGSYDFEFSNDYTQLRRI